MATGTETDAASQADTEAEPLVHILWMNGGLGCDGDSVALTAATQPSIEEIALGALPGLPKIAVHWPLIDFECGPETGADNFIEWWHKADRGELDPFVLVVEGSIPNEAIKEEGYWCGFGNNPATGQPMTTNEWLDRLAPKATAILAAGTCATYGGIHAMAGNPTGAMGVPDYLGWDWRSKAGLPIVCVPGCPTHPDNLSETILYLLYQVAGQAPMIPLDEALRPTWLFGATVHEGCDRAGLLRAGRVRHRVRLAQVPGQAGLLGARGQVQRAEARLDQRRRRAAPTSAGSASRARCRASPTSSCRSWTSRRARRCRPPRARSTGRSSARSAGSRRGPPTRSRSGARRATSSYRLQEELVTSIGNGPRRGASRDGRPEAGPSGWHAGVRGRPGQQRGVSDDNGRRRRPRGDGLGPDHADRGQPGHLHQD